MSDNDDLTRIEDLSEFMHEDDPDTDALLTDQDSEDESMASSDIDSLESDEFEESDSFSDSFSESDNDEFEESEDVSFDEDTQSFDSTEDSFEGHSEEELESFEEDDNDTESFETSENEDSFDEGFQEDEAQEIEELDETDGQEVEQTFEADDNEEVTFETNEYEENGFEESPIEEEPEELEGPPSPEEQAPATPPPTPETFSDVQNFAKNMSYGKVATGGNPAYSIILKNIKYVEDTEDILIILREHGLCSDKTEADFKQGLENGSLLISQISEFSAIYLTHKFRRFDLDILTGLSEEIHPTKSYSQDSVGLVHKSFVNQNKREEQNLEAKPVTIDEIIVTTTPQVEGHTIHKYLGIISEHSLIKEDEIRRIHHAKSMDEDELFADMEDTEENILTNYALGLNEIYDGLSNDLKEQALKLKGNAVVGVSFQVTPLSNESSDEIGNIEYKITATANAVWLSYSGD